RTPPPSRSSRGSSTTNRSSRASESAMAATTATSPTAASTRAVISDVEAEVDHVAVLDDVVLAHETEPPGLAAARHALVLRERRERDHLGTDDPARDVAVDLA